MVRANLKVMRRAAALFALFALPALCQAAVLEAYGQLPIAFEENRGQTDSRVRYFAHSGENALFLTSSAIVLRLAGAAVYLRLRGANPQARVEGLDPLPGVTNYFLGSDPARWRTGAPNYARVRYHDVYPGIDLVFYGDAGRLEYDFVVTPDGAADPRVIELEIAGVDRLRLADDGDLVLETAAGEICQHRPRVYQEFEGVRRELAGRYRLQEGRRFRFEVGEYDRTRPLIIDPVLSYNTRIGPRPFTSGTQLAGFERGVAGIAVDAAGNAYLVGSTTTADFPITPGAFQTAFGKLLRDTVYVAKLNPAGTALLYSTFLGGSGDDVGAGIAIDGAGNAYVTGYTESSNFPVTAGASQTNFPVFSRTGFVAKLNPSGSGLVYSTFLGGSLATMSRGIAVDAAGDAYVTGTTGSADFPTTPGAFRSVVPSTFSANPAAFVTKINPAGSGLVYSTYLGPARADVYFLPALAPNAIAVDSAGNAYVGGTTAFRDFPVTDGAMRSTDQTGLNGFVTKLNAAGSDLVYSALIGGSALDGVSSIAVDAAGSAYVVGFTDSPDFPTTPGSFQPNSTPEIPVPFPLGLRLYPRYGFAMKLKADGTAPIYSTYLGGAGNIVVSSVAIDAAGHAFIAGSTDAPNFTTTPDALQPCIGDEFSFANAFLLELDPAGSKPLYSTYLGGNVRDDGAAVALDRAGNVYLAGRSDSSNFAPTPGALGNASGPNFVSRIDFSIPSPSFALACMANAASLAAGPVAPGEIVSLFGTGIGPAKATTYRVTAAGLIDTTLAETRVLFDGAPAPLLFVSANQINAVVPYAVTPRTSTQVQVEFHGKQTNSLTVAVRDASPGIFTANSSGIGQGAILNQDGTLNSPNNPADRGSIITLFATRGSLQAAVTLDGAIATEAKPGGFPGLTIGLRTAGIPYSGTSPGQVAALVQVNAFVPRDAPTGGAVPIAIVSGASSIQQRVTVAIR